MFEGHRGHPKREHVRGGGFRGTEQRAPFGRPVRGRQPSLPDFRKLSADQRTLDSSSSGNRPDPSTATLTRHWRPSTSKGTADTLPNCSLRLARGVDSVESVAVDKNGELRLTAREAVCCQKPPNNSNAAPSRAAESAAHCARRSSPLRWSSGKIFLSLRSTAIRAIEGWLIFADRRARHQRAFIVIFYSRTGRLTIAGCRRRLCHA